MKDLARPVPFEFGNHPQQKIPKVSHDSASIHAPLQNASREVGFSFGSIRSFKRDTSPGRSAREYKRFQLDQNSFRISPFYQNLTERQHYYHHRKHLRFQRMKDDKYDDDGNASTSSFVSARSSPSETSHATNDSKSSIDSLISRLDAVSLDTEKLLKEHEPRLRNDAYLVFTKNYIRIRQKAQNILDTYLDRGLDLDEEYEKTAIPEPRAVKPLTDEEKEMVRGVMKKGQNGEIARLKTAIVEYKDIYKLYPETWLNDEIINFYMELISDRANSENSNLPSVHCFNTFFCSTLREHGYAKVRRWTKRVDIFAKDLIFIPINYSYHWTLGVIDMRNKTIRIYDSLHGHHDSTLRLLLSYLEDEHMDKKKEPIDLSDWQIDAPKDIPRQGNMSDCGVFTCTFAERLSRQQSFDFSQRDMEIIRQRMVLSIIHKSIQ